MPIVPILLAAGAILVLLIVQLFWLVDVLAWSAEATNGLGYYGLDTAGRERFRSRLRRQARALQPILRLMRPFSRFTFEKATFHARGLPGPRGTCSAASFERGMAYEPSPDDVFVVTQMKCGTTWMQYLVHEVLHRGAGTLVESGTTLYAVSPWLEGLKSVPVNEAPLLGRERPSRIIKTHLPASVCPFSTSARYIYVARHPVSCLASCHDFIATNAGRLAPDLDAVERWFCSDLMWWGPWPDHLAGWSQRSREADNVLLVHFEDMKADLPNAVRRVAEFLGVRLTEDEVASVARKAGFSYMKEHADLFEMHPPHLMQIDAELFVRGSADRHRDLPAATGERVLDWCEQRMNTLGTALPEPYRSTDRIGPVDPARR